MNRLLVGMFAFVLVLSPVAIALHTWDAVKEINEHGYHMISGLGLSLWMGSAYLMLLWSVVKDRKWFARKWREGGLLDREAK